MSDVALMPPLRRSLDIRRPLLDAAMLCIVAGSQWGMLILAAIYVHIGRVASMTSPEAIAGLLAICLALLVVRLHVRSASGRKHDVTFTWLLCFIVVSCVGELLRPDLRAGNLTFFISLGIYYLIGSAIGHDVAGRGMKIPLLGLLLAIYSVWYFVLLLFFIRGDLGFYGVLPTSDLLRLEFREGFTATELPIYVGFQAPALMYVIFFSRSGVLRLWAWLLMVCCVVLVMATVSAAAMAAVLLVVLVFVVSRGGLSLGSVFKALLMLCIVVALVFAASPGLIASVQEKIANFAVGEGIRAVIYAELVADIIQNPLGIGKGRFVDTNNFSWLGEGVYPHHNLLGIGAELGVPALILFVGFMISAIAVLARTGLRPASSSSATRMLAATVLAMFLYQQFRGLFQDTWIIRETYFWLGLGIGALTAASNDRAPVHKGSD